MADSKTSKVRTKRPPARTKEARERQLIGLAIDLAEEQLASGKASPLIINHFLKLGSSSSNLEREKLEEEVSLMRSRREVLEAEKNVGELYDRAIEAMRRYSGASFDENI